MTPERGQGSESSDIMAGVCEQWDELQTLIALINARAENPDAPTNLERNNPLIYEIQGHPALVGSAVDALRQAFPKAAKASYEDGKDEINLFGWTPLRLLQKIEAGLLHVIAEPSEDESAPSSQTAKKDANKDKVADVVNRIKDLLKNIKDGSGGVAPVIILEDYDRIPEGLRKVIEDQLLGPVAADRSAVVVITNGRISDDRTDIRRTTNTRLFNGVEKPEELFPEISSEIDTDLLQQITGGFPDAIAYVYNKASKEGVLRDADKFNKLLKEIAEDDDFKEWVIEEIMGRDSDERELITMLAVLRGFDPPLAKQLIKEFTGNELGVSERNDWINSMSTNLQVRPGIYALDPRIAGMISAYTDHHPEHAKELHDRAANLYLGLIYDSKSPAIQYVVEYLYHQLAIIRIEQDGTGEDAQVERQMIGFISDVVSGLKPNRNQFSRLMTYDLDLHSYWSAYAKSLKQN